MRPYVPVDTRLKTLRTRIIVNFKRLATTFKRHDYNQELYELCVAVVKMGEWELEEFLQWIRIFADEAEEII